MQLRKDVEYDILIKKGGSGMFLLVFIFVLLLMIALLHGYVESFRTGPSHCMGCGKCDHNGGICILTGRHLHESKTVAQRKSSPLTNGENGI